MFRPLDYWNDDDDHGQFVGIREALGWSGMAMVGFGLLIWIVVIGFVIYSIFW